MKEFYNEELKRIEANYDENINMLQNENHDIENKYLAELQQKQIDEQSWRAKVSELSQEIDILKNETIKKDSSFFKHNSF